MILAAAGGRRPGARRGARWSALLAALALVQLQWLPALAEQPGGAPSAEGEPAVSGPLSPVPVLGIVASDCDARCLLDSVASVDYPVERVVIVRGDSIAYVTEATAEQLHDAIPQLELLDVFREGNATGAEERGRAVVAGWNRVLAYLTQGEEEAPEERLDPDAPAGDERYAVIVGGGGELSPGTLSRLAGFMEENRGAGLLAWLRMPAAASPHGYGFAVSASAARRAGPMDESAPGPACAAAEFRQRAWRHRVAQLNIADSEAGRPPAPARIDAWLRDGRPLPPTPASPPPAPPTSPPPAAGRDKFLGHRDHRLLRYEIAAAHGVLDVTGVRVPHEQLARLRASGALFEHTVTMCYPGLVFAWRADFLLSLDSPPHAPNLTRAILEEYDVVITISPLALPPVSRPQVRLMMPSEPIFVDEWREQMPADYCPVILDNFSNDRTYPAVAIWYRYLIKEMRAFAEGEKRRAVLIGKADNRTALEAELRGRGYEVFQQGAFASVPYSRFYGAFARCKYAIHVDTWPSAGQILAESAVLGVIAFAPPERLYQRLLFPRFCRVASVEEAVAKIEQVEANATLYWELRATIEARVRKLDHENLYPVSDLLDSIPSRDPRCDLQR
eukprot:tig00000241_g20869.t1